ncbi:MAG: hypothetical protein AAFU54_10530 [Chloroflexota bacterium]
MRAAIQAVCIAALLLSAGGRLAAQAPRPFQAFVVPGADGEDDTLLFVDVITGEITEVPAQGDRYTVAGNAVLFIDRESGQVLQATPDGSVSPHPFIQRTDTTHRMDWVVSRDNTHIAWTVTTLEADGTLSTLTRVATPDGTQARDVLVDGPLPGVRAFPVAFSVDSTTLYMDYQPDGLGALTPYDEYAGLFAVRPDAPNDITSLPGEPGCYCGAGFGGDYFLRLAVSDDLTGFNLRLFDLQAQVEREISGSSPQNFTQGGDVLISDDGTRAIYAVAQVRDFGSPGQVVQSVFMLVDIDAGTQEQITVPQTLFIRPVAWTEGNEAIIFTSPTRPGTWKMNADSGQLSQLSEARYIGASGL